MSCWNKKSRMDKSLFSVTVAAVLMCTIMAVLLTIFGFMHQKHINAKMSLRKPESASLDADKICLTSHCVKAAAELLNSMDEAADPCHNFYHFVCSEWEDTHTIEKDRSFVSVVSEVYDLMMVRLKALVEESISDDDPDFIVTTKKMYNLCLDAETLDKLQAAPLENMLKKLGGWPVVEGSKWKGENFDWIDQIIKFRKLGLDHGILIDVYVEPNKKNNTAYIVTIDETKLGMPDKSYYSLVDENSTVIVHQFFTTSSQRILKAYADWMLLTARMFGVDSEIGGRELTEALNFEKRLANIMIENTDKENKSLSYDVITVKKLYGVAPGIDWLKYLNGLLNHEITEYENVRVPTNFIADFSKLIRTTNPRVVANHMIWRVVQSSLNLLSKDHLALDDNYIEILTGRTQEKARWEWCLSTLMSGPLKVAISYLYVRHLLKRDNKDSALEMSTFIFEEFSSALATVDWMDEETREKASEKIQDIDKLISYPEMLLDDTAVSGFYTNLSVTEHDFFNSFWMMKKWEVDYLFGRLREPIDRPDWRDRADILHVNAIYKSVEKSIRIPASILQKPFFYKDRPMYLNFGALGSIIAHEITHALGAIGKHSDETGVLENWWSSKTEKMHKEKAQCIIDQYSNYTEPVTCLKINGILTQIENFADVGGVKQAYLAYKAWVKKNGEEKGLPGLDFSPEQLFWISAANIWCGKMNRATMVAYLYTVEYSPNMFRVIGPLSNSEEFAKDFKCSEKSLMNPAKKCSVW